MAPRTLKGKAKSAPKKGEEPQKAPEPESLKELKDYKHPGTKEYFHLCVILKPGQEIPHDYESKIKEHIGEKKDIIMHFIVGSSHCHEPIRIFCVQNGYRFKSWNYSEGGGSKSDKNKGYTEPKHVEPAMIDTLTGALSTLLYL